MKYLSLLAMAAIALSGCGATYTKIDRPKVENPASTTNADCPNGINYKTGHCR